MGTEGGFHAPQVIYQSNRYGSRLNYNLAGVPNGNYTVRLHFAETYYSAANLRKFNVSVEGVSKLTSFAIFAQTGGKNRAVVKIFDNVTVSGGLQVDLVGTLSTAQINGINGTTLRG